MEKDFLPPLHESLRAEFEMVQRKIDNIGEFKFRVRGWSLTLQTGIVIAVATGKISDAAPWYFYPVLGALALGVIFLFHLLEQQQEFIGRALGRRSFAIEWALDQLTVEREWSEKKKAAVLKNALEKVEGSPRIAPTMQLAARHGFCRTISAMLWPLNPFYVFQYVLTILAVTTFFFARPSIRPQPSKQISEPKQTSNIYHLSLDLSQHTNNENAQVDQSRTDRSETSSISRR